MFLKYLKITLLPFFLGIGLIGNSIGQPAYEPFSLHQHITSTGFPVAIYNGIDVKELRRLVIAAFKESNFSLIAVIEKKNAATVFKFSYPVYLNKKESSLVILIKMDENSNSTKKCANCFLRYDGAIDDSSLKNTGWMVRYDLSSNYFPDIDRAFERLQVSSQKYMDADFGFRYQKQWKGERNLYDNSFVGIKLTDLKGFLIKSQRDSGFVFIEDSDTNSNARNSVLKFYFPINAEKTGGVTYAVKFMGQFDENGFCYPCETLESYDPSQQLPPAGLSGMSDRVTLESRFAAARTYAYEQLKLSVERYLRPRTVFSVPPKPAPLGSPRPSPMPVAVT